MTPSKRIGILETGTPSSGRVEKFSRYPAMFENLLRPLAPEWDFEVFPVLEGKFPPSPESCDGWIVTGSPHGVYEELPWMLKTEDLLRRIVNARIPVIGVCFGHQILAKAMGGRVEKSTRGWGLGYLDFKVIEQTPWMQPPLRELKISSIHQDQVVEMPPSGTVIARSEFSPHAMISYGDTAFSIQSHPEFTPAFLNACIADEKIPAETREKALRSMEAGQADSAVIAQWMINFLRQDFKTPA